MKLTDTQIDFYTENGYLIIENFLNDLEIDLLNSEFPKTIEKESPRIIMEDNGEVRSVFAPHFINDCYKRLSKLDRLVIPSQQLIGNKIYLYQYKINMKKGLKSDKWEWHQDFPYWHIDDGVPRPDLISVMLYLQDTDAANGALMLIPKSHKQGIAKFAEKDILIKEKEVKNDLADENYLSSLNSNIKFTVDADLVQKTADKNSVITAEGKKGMLLFFHSNIFHASNRNLSPFDRKAIILTYNSIYNIPTNNKNPRPEYLVSRQYQPIELFEKYI